MQILARLQIEPSNDYPELPQQLEFGGITDAMMLTLKQRIAEIQ